MVVHPARALLGGSHVFEKIGLQMNNLKFPIHRFNLEHREVLFLIGGVADVDLKEVAGLGIRIHQGVDPVHDLLLLRRGEMAIELVERFLFSLRRGIHVEISDPVFHQVQNEDTNRIPLVGNQIIVFLLAFGVDDKGYHQEENAEENDG